MNELHLVLRSLVAPNLQNSQLTTRVMKKEIKILVPLPIYTFKITPIAYFLEETKEMKMAIVILSV